MSVPGTPERMVVNIPRSFKRRIARPVVRFGPRPPSPFAPWQALQDVANSFLPAATASGWPANGFRSDADSGRGNWAQSGETVMKSAQICRILLRPHIITGVPGQRRRIGFERNFLPSADCDSQVLVLGNPLVSYIFQLDTIKMRNRANFVGGWRIMSRPPVPTYTRSISAYKRVGLVKALE